VKKSDIELAMDMRAGKAIGEDELLIHPSNVRPVPAGGVARETGEAAAKDAVDVPVWYEPEKVHPRTGKVTEPAQFHTPVFDDAHTVESGGLNVYADDLDALQAKVEAHYGRPVLLEAADDEVEAAGKEFFARQVEPTAGGVARETGETGVSLGDEVEDFLEEGVAPDFRPFSDQQMWDIIESKPEVRDIYLENWDRLVRLMRQRAKDGPTGPGSSQEWLERFGGGKFDPSNPEHLEEILSIGMPAEMNQEALRGLRGSTEELLEMLKRLEELGD